MKSLWIKSVKCNEYTVNLIKWLNISKEEFKWLNIKIIFSAELVLDVYEKESALPYYNFIIISRERQVKVLKLLT
jgi:hypothetical protein